MKKASWQQYPNIDVCASFLNRSQLEVTGLFQSITEKKLFPLSAWPQEMKMPTFNSRIFKVPTIQMNIRR